MIREKDRLVGESPAFLSALDEVSAVAPLEKPVLVVGERGTGKELIAARLHYLSSRWDATFLKMNCAAISDSLLESELFGHEAGAFTGASRAHQGRFERADGGTLFLDELATTSVLVQEKILRVIEYGEFERLGGSKTLRADVRLIAGDERGPAPPRRRREVPPRPPRPPRLRRHHPAAPAGAPRGHRAPRGILRHRHGDGTRTRLLPRLRPRPRSNNSRPTPGPATCAN